MYTHDDVIKWKRFPRYWPFVRGIHRWPVNSLHKGQWRGALVFFYLLLNKQLSKQWWWWWFETPSPPLWRHCNEWGDATADTNTVRECRFRRLLVIGRKSQESLGNASLSRTVGLTEPIFSVHLVHWGREKMAALFPDDIFKSIFLNENV